MIIYSDGVCPVRLSFFLVIRFLVLRLCVRVCVRYLILTEWYTMPCRVMMRHTARYAVDKCCDDNVHERFWLKNNFMVFVQSGRPHRRYWLIESWSDRIYLCSLATICVTKINECSKCYGILSYYAARTRNRNFCIFSEFSAPSLSVSHRIFWNRSNETWIICSQLPICWIIRSGNKCSELCRAISKPIKLN